MRSKTGATAALNSTTQSAGQTPDTQEANMSQQPTFDPTEDAETAPLSPPPTNNTSTAHQSIAVTATTNPKRRQPRRPRAPSPSTLARASLIDQIMRESNHTPHYTPATDTGNRRRAASTLWNSFLCHWLFYRTASRQRVSRQRRSITLSLPTLGHIATTHHGDDTQRQRRAGKDAHGGHASAKATNRAQEAEDAGKEGRG